MTTLNPLEEALVSYAQFLRRTQELGVVGHRGGLTATRALLQICDPRAGQRLLEVGCGSGYTARAAAKQSNAFIVAIDRAPHLLARTWERAQAIRVTERVAVILGDALELPFADAAFDGLICESVLGFLEDRGAAVQEFYRVIKPGGLLANNEVTFLKPPPADFLAALRNAAARMPGALAVPVGPEEHQQLLRKAGFSSVHAETGDISTIRQLREQVQIDGLRALRPLFSAIFDPELRKSAYRREMAQAQRTFREHTGYGLYFARKPEGS